MQTPVGGRRGSAIMYASGCDFSYSMNIVYNAVIVYLYVVDSIVLLQCWIHVDAADILDSNY